MKNFQDNFKLKFREIEAKQKLFKDRIRINLNYKMFK